MRAHMRQLLRETITRRVVGLKDAIADLGTHTVCGHEVEYSHTAIYNVLKGRCASRRLLQRIIDRRPDLLGLSCVADSTKAAAIEMGWTADMTPPRRAGGHDNKRKPAP